MRQHPASQDVRRLKDLALPELGVRMHVELKDADQQPPRATYTIAVEAPDVERAVGNFEAAALAVGGRRVDFNQSADGGKRVARVVMDVPLSAAGQMIQEAGRLGDVTTTQTTRDEGVPEGNLSRARVELTLGTPERIVKADEGFGSAIREGLRTGLKGLFLCLEFIIVGLLVVLPLGVLVWAVWRLFRRSRRRPAAGPTTPTAPPSGGPVVTPA